MANKLGMFLAGGLLGAGLALLYAPRSGQETRALVSEKVGAAWGETQEFGAQAAEQVKQAAAQAQAKGQEFAQAAQAKGQEVYTQAASRV